MLIGYARVSSIQQNLDRQISALRTQRCDLIFREKASGKSVKGRPELEKAIDQLGEGDVFVIAEWDRATRSMLDGIALIERIASRGAAVKVLDRAYLDLTTTIGKGIMALFSAMAQDERERIIKRANEGRTAARRRGVHMGRKPKLSPERVATARERMARGESARFIAKEWGVSHTTIARAR